MAPRFATPAPYVAVHVALGALAFRWPLLWAPVVAYNLAQLALGVRFFVHRWRAEPGNSAAYTVFKLAQYGAGWALALAAQAVAGRLRAKEEGAGR